MGDLGAVYRSQLQRYNQLRILRKVKLRTSCWLSIFVLESKDIALTTVLVTGPAEASTFREHLLGSPTFPWDMAST